MIDNELIDKIKRACWVGDFMEEDGHKLTKKGVNYLTLCPFHADRHLGGFVVDGRRDRYTCFSCGAHGNSIDYLMQVRSFTFIQAIKYAAAKYGIYIEDNEMYRQDIKVTKQHVAPPPLPMLTLPADMPSKLGHTENNTLCQWLRSLNWDDEQREWMEKVLQFYMLGHGKEGHTVFWQIDSKGNVRTGKMMKYKPDGHRDKEAEHSFDWVHSVLLRNHRWSDEQYEMQTCLFGEHLLPAIPDDMPVHIVESEKTAIICAIAYKFPNWMSTGGMQFLDYKHLEPLILTNRKIVCHPDRDGVSAWRKKANMIGYDRLRIDTGFFKEWTEADGAKADIADIVVRLMQQQNKSIMERLVNMHPSIQQLIDKLKLERQ